MFWIHTHRTQTRHHGMPRVREVAGVHWDLSWRMIGVWICIYINDKYGYVYLYIKIGTYTNIYMKTYVDRYMCIYGRWYVYLYVKIGTYTYIYMKTYVDRYMCIHGRWYVYLYVNIGTYTYTYMKKCVDRYMCIYGRWYVYLYVKIGTYTYIYMKTYVDRYMCIYGRWAEILWYAYGEVHVICGYIWYPQTEEVGLEIITTAKLSTSFHGSLCNFQTGFHGIPRKFGFHGSKWESPDYSRRLYNLKIQVFKVWSPPWADVCVSWQTKGIYINVYIYIHVYIYIVMYIYMYVYYLRVHGRW